MKLYTTPYHYDLIKDTDRVSAFYEAIQDIKQKNTNIVFDLGTGVGLMSIFLADKYDEVIAIEINPESIKQAKKNLSIYNNIQLIHDDASTYQFNRKTDLIVCEMLDTGLIDEEQVPVLNNALKYLNNNGKTIPYGIINIAEPLHMKTPRLTYEDVNQKLNYEIISDKIIYDKIIFNKPIKPEYHTVLKFNIKPDKKINAIKLTTITLVNENIILGPTPMLNPPLIIPLEKEITTTNGETEIELEYTMGEGIQTIKTYTKMI